MDITGIVLVGGKSKRFGENKFLQEIKSEKIYKIIYKKLKPIFYDLIFVINNFSLIDLNVKKVKDIIKDKGPLGGIYTGLLFSKTKYNFIFACDMPFLNVNLIKYMINVCSGYLAVVPKVNGIPQPLHSIYSKELIPVILKKIKEGDLEIKKVFENLNVKFIEGEIKNYDPDYLSFFNINTIDDLKKALKLEEEKCLI